MIIAVSSSKNIGLYRERAGAVVFVGGDARAAEAMKVRPSLRRGAFTRYRLMVLLAGQVLSARIGNCGREQPDGGRINGLRGSSGMR